MHSPETSPKTCRWASRPCTGSRAGEPVKESPWASGDGVSAMRFKGVDRRHGKMLRASSCFGPPSFHPTLRPFARRWGTVLPPAASGGGRTQARFPAQAEPLLNIIGEASPQHLAAGFLQPPHAELPQAELGLQPQVAELGHRPRREAVKESPLASGDGVSAMGFEGFDRRRGKMAYGRLHASILLRSARRCGLTRGSLGARLPPAGFRRRPGSGAVSSAGGTIAEYCR